MACSERDVDYYKNPLNVGSFTKYDPDNSVNIV